MVDLIFAFGAGLTLFGLGMILRETQRRPAPLYAHARVHARWMYNTVGAPFSHN